jgi:hypothetical protein
MHFYLYVSSSEIQVDLIDSIEDCIIVAIEQDELVEFLTSHADIP